MNLTDFLGVATIESGPMAVFSDTKANNVHGGASAAGWHKRDINTEEVNNIPGLSLANSTLTFPRGEFLIQAVAILKNSNAGRIGLHDVASGSRIAMSVNARTISTRTTGGTVILYTHVNFAAPTDIELWYWSQNAVAGDGLGIRGTKQRVSKYAIITVRGQE